MFMFDIETLGVESTTVILSAGIIYFDPEVDADITYAELMERGLFVKFDAKEQLKSYDRTMTKSTLDWWAGQGPYQKKSSFDIDPENDVPVVDGFRELHKYINKYRGKKTWATETVWARGSLDQMAIDSLALKAGLDPIAPFNRWRDIRTAIDMLYGTSNGYCQIRDIDMHVIEKHHPVHDCAFDILMLLRGIDESPQ